MTFETRTKTYAVTSLIWFTVLLCALAYVFVTTGCNRRGPDGPRGYSYTGPRGEQGLPGESIVGPSGPPGIDAVPTQVVPLCPGTSNYGTFVEVALLINGKLWAVYSSNGGFMTYLAPGNYSSNGIGSACNFTVNADNSISH